MVEAGEMEFRSNFDVIHSVYQGERVRKERGKKEAKGVGWSSFGRLPYFFWINGGEWVISRISIVIPAFC